MPKIIGISGISGAGKTTLTRELSNRTGMTAVYWDDFDDISTSPEDYVEWYKSNRDLSAWDYPKLAETLATLKKGQSLICPATSNKLLPTDFIFFDAPCGRAHKQTGQYIDMHIHLNTPLDIALARRTIRDFSHDKASLNDLLDDLRYYLISSRPLFDAQEISEGADLTVDGSLSTDEQCSLILEYIEEKNVKVG